MTDLPGQVEDKRLSPQRLSHRILVGHVDDAHRDMSLNVCEVEAVRASVRHQGIDNRHLRPEFHQPPDKIAPDKPVTTGDQNGYTGESSFRKGHHRLRLAPCRTVSRHHKRSMSKSTSAMRGAVKNCERPYGRR